jgi:hypothetical protein
MANHTSTSTLNLKTPTNIAVGNVGTGLTLSPKQVNDISLLFGGSLVKSSEDLMDKLRRSQTIRFMDGVSVTLNSDVLWSLQQQAQGMSIPYEDYVKQFIENAIQWQLQGFRGTL